MPIESLSRLVVEKAVVRSLTLLPSPYLSTSRIIHPVIDAAIMFDIAEATIVVSTASCHPLVVFGHVGGGIHDRTPNHQRWLDYLDWRTGNGNAESDIEPPKLVTKVHKVHPWEIALLGFNLYFGR